MDLYGVIGTSSYANLLEDPRGAEKIAVNILPGIGEVKAGTLLYRLSSGYYTKATTDQLTTSYDVVVLGEDVDAGESPDVNVEDAMAYRAGRFIKGAVKLASGTITAAHYVALRNLGILVKVDSSASTFDNTVVMVTYNANDGSTTPATYEVQEIKGATHTALANTVTNFTAPTGKVFSKWNTKADGSGDNVNAAGTITVSADTVLYAVWANSGT